MSLTFSQALWFLPFAGPIGIWIAWSDLKFMRIANKSVLALGVVFLVVGLIALPFETYLGRLLHIVVVLACGFAMNMMGWIGGGDAKYAAAIAPFVALSDAITMLFIFSAMLLAAYFTHRLFRSMGFIRKLTADWQSWNTGKDFPMGLALSGSLLAYLLLGLVRGSL